MALRLLQLRFQLPLFTVIGQTEVSLDPCLSNLALLFKQPIGVAMRCLFLCGALVLSFQAPVFGFSVITDIFKAKDIANRLGERICALREAGYSEGAAVRTGTKQMSKELSNTKLNGTMAKNAFKDTLTESLAKCGIKPQ